MAPPTKYGSPLKYDPDLCGPQKHRSCTDILCLLLFLFFLAAWAGVASFAYRNGDPKRLMLPVDSYGHRCGEPDLINPNLFFFDLTACLSPDAIWRGCSTPQVCVSKCPEDVWIAETYLSGVLQFNITDVQNHLICYNETIIKTVVDKNTLKDVVNKKACASWYVPSQPFYFRCIPNLKFNYEQWINNYKQKYGLNVPFSTEMLNQSARTMQTLNELNQVAQDVVHDLDATWRYLIIFCFAALVVSFVYILLLRFLAGIVVWISILALIALFSSGVFFSYKNYKFLKDNQYGRIVPDSNSLEGKVTQLFNKWEFWMLLLVVCAFFLIFIVLIIVFLRSRIYLATALIKESSKAVSSAVSTLFFPIIPWAVQLVVLLWSISVFLFLYSTGTDDRRIEGMDGNCICTGPYQGIIDNTTCTVEEFNKFCHQAGDVNSHCYTAGCAIRSLNSTNLVLYLQMFNLFGFFWGVWFVTGLAQMILAGTFATWYWTFHKRNVPFFTLSRAIFRTLWYHMGTVAFGSLIIAICSFIRAMIEYAEKKVKKFDNAITKAIICCCKCFFWCLEKFLCFINRNAYIMCAIHGQNFCTSAKDAFQLLMRNVIRVIFVDKVTDFLFFLGKVLVTAVLVVMSYHVFTGQVRLLDDSGRDVVLVYPWLPMAIVGLMTYIIVSIFFSVYSVAVDTLFLCFLEDCERNDGSAERPYFMSKQLMKILGKKNKRV
uniref:Choline transporter-like protein n=1 Tax=Homalodisca liturata TaxID=320908 RepID=A0A1B6JVG8_9HEMI